MSPAIAVADPSHDAERERVREWARKMNPPATKATELIATTPTWWGLNPLLRGPVASPPRLDPTAGITAEVVACAVAAGVDVAGVAGLALAKLPPLDPHAIKFNVETRERYFDAWFVEKVAREAAVLGALAAGREVVEAEVDREAGRVMVRSWWNLGRGIAGLVASAAAASVHYDRVAEARGAELARLARELRGGGSFEAFASEAPGLAADRTRALARRDAIRAALEALPASLAPRVRAAVDLIGGPEKLATAIREAASVAGLFPGPDRKLGEIQKTLEEAAGLMMTLAPPDGEPEGQMYATARKRRDELVEALADRKAVVAREAVEKIRGSIDSALAGDPEAVGRLAATAEKHVEAFPPAYRRALASAALEAAAENSVGLMWCLA